MYKIVNKLCLFRPHALNSSRRPLLTANTGSFSLINSGTFDFDAMNTNLLGTLLGNLSDLFWAYQTKKIDKQELINGYYTQYNLLLTISAVFGFDENIWQNYLTLFLVTNENSFSLSCERRKSKNRYSVLAQEDLKLIRSLYQFNFSQIDEELSEISFGVHPYQTGEDKEYRANNKIHAKQQLSASYDQFTIVGHRVHKLQQTLTQAADNQEFYNALTEYYYRYGCGLLGQFTSFRIATSEDSAITGSLVELQPIHLLSKVSFDDLIGYEKQKQQLKDNTKAFLAGASANNLLLHGDSGTGKSTCIRALANHYSKKGLKIIEVYKHQLIKLPAILNYLSQRNYYFILYMDDLSFEDFETDFKHLKAVIEGGLAAQPTNILIYATSNRRHLIKETWSDRSDRGKTDGDDIHHSDTAEEKISLVNRFGLTIYFPRPGKKQYLAIVQGIAARYPKLELPEEALLAEADRWGISLGNISGRRAKQFIDHLVGKFAIEKDDDATKGQ